MPHETAVVLDDVIVGSFPIIIELKLGDFDTEFRRKCALYNSHYQMTPPFPRMDIDDPAKDKPRFVTTLPQFIVQKGVRAMYGMKKFNGFDSLVYPESMPDGEKDAHRFLYEILDVTQILRELENRAIITGEGWCEFLFIGTGDLAVNEVETCDVEIVVHPLSKKRIMQVVITHREGDVFFRRVHTTEAIAYYEGKLESREIPGSVSTGPFSYRVPLKEEVIVLHRINVIVHGLGIIPCIRLMHERGDDGRGVSVYHGLIDKFDHLNQLMTNILFAHDQQLDPLVFATGVRKGSDLWRDADAVWYFANERAMVRILEWEGVPDSTKMTMRNLLVDIMNKVALPVAILLEDPKVYEFPHKGLLLLYSDWIDLTGFRQQDVKEFVQAFFRVLVNLVNQRDVIPTDLFNRIINADQDLSKEEMVEVIPKFDQFNIPTKVLFGPVIPPNIAADRTYALELYGHGIITGERLIEISDLADSGKVIEEYTTQLKGKLPPLLQGKGAAGVKTPPNQSTENR